MLYFQVSPEAQVSNRSHLFSFGEHFCTFKKKKKNRNTKEIQWILSRLFD